MTKEKNTKECIKNANEKSPLEKNQERLIDKKRYEIAMAHSNVRLFDYNVKTGQSFHSKVAMEKYDFPPVVNDAIETICASGIVHPNSRETLRELFKKIHENEPFAKGTLSFVDKNGNETINEMTLIQVLNEEGYGIWVIGAVRDITEQQKMLREKKYHQSMIGDKRLIYEANLFTDQLIFLDKCWAESLKLTEKTSFSRLMAALSKKVREDQVRSFHSFFRSEHLISSLKEGKKQVSIEYQKKDKETVYVWVENMVSLIKDSVTQEVQIRCYYKNIDAEINRKKKIEEECRFYETMFGKTSTIYEINLSRNHFIRGHQEWEKLFGIESSTVYSEMVAEFSKRGIHKKDAEAFKERFLRENVLRTFYSGLDHIYLEYRRLDESKNFIWSSCTLHLLEDPKSNDVRGICYIQNIDEEKTRELKLIYKSEHDALTKVYNKQALENYVREFFNSEKGQTGEHAFFVIDIDHFKSINDGFGHAFGDTILSETARKIREVFRDEDIIGRIGGDEFGILMKNVSQTESLNVKAKQLCEIIRESHSSKEKDYTVSVSVGLSVFPSDGFTFNTLFTNADKALYVAKENGRNQFCHYHLGMDQQKIFEKKIDVNELLDQKIFKNNVGSYVFRILNDSGNQIFAMNTVLELIGRHWNYSRISIFEMNENGIRNTFEWCDEGTFSQIKHRKEVTVEALKQHETYFNEDGFFYQKDVSKLSQKTKESLGLETLAGMLQFKITKKGRFRGIISFEKEKNELILNQEEIAEVKEIASIIGNFIIEIRTIQRNEATKEMALAIVNSLDSYAYVIQPKTWEILFLNDKIQSILPEAMVGDLCYQHFFNRETSCLNCPLEALKKGNATNSTMELYSENLNIWMRATAAWISWIDGKEACIVNSFDITEYKK